MGTGGGGEKGLPSLVTHLELITQKNTTAPSHPHQHTQTHTHSHKQMSRFWISATRTVLFVSSPSF